MKTSRNVLLAIAAGGALLTAVPAFAQNWNHGYGQRHYSAAGPRYYGPPRVAYAPLPLYHRLSPVLYAPAHYYGPQVAYARPRPHGVYRR